MLNYSLVFSEKRSIRIKRHLLFWGFWWCYFGMMHAVQPFGRPEISYFRNLPFTISESILLMLPQVVLTYPMLYFVLPRFILHGLITPSICRWMARLTRKRCSKKSPNRNSKRRLSRRALKISPNLSLDS